MKALIPKLPGVLHLLLYAPDWRCPAQGRPSLARARSKPALSLTKRWSLLLLNRFQLYIFSALLSALSKWWDLLERKILPLFQGILWLLLPKRSQWVNKWLSVRIERRKLFQMILLNPNGNFFFMHWNPNPTPFLRQVLLLNHLNIVNLVP